MNNLKNLPLHQLKRMDTKESKFLACKKMVEMIDNDVDYNLIQNLLNTNDRDWLEFIYKAL